MCPGSLGMKLLSLCALVRYFARKTLSHLWPCADFERVSSRVLGLTSLQQLSEAVELLRTKVRAALLLVAVVGGVTRLAAPCRGLASTQLTSARLRPVTPRETPHGLAGALVTPTRAACPRGGSSVGCSRMTHHSASPADLCDANEASQMLR